MFRNQSSSAGDYATTHMLELSNLVGPFVQSAGHVTLTMENRDTVFGKSFSYGSVPPGTLLFTPKWLVTGKSPLISSVVHPH